MKKFYNVKKSEINNSDKLQESEIKEIEVNDEEDLKPLTAIEISNTQSNGKVEKDDKQSFEDFKKLYKGVIDIKCNQEFGSTEDKDLWEDCAKELFLKSKEYILQGDEHKPEQLEKKEESKQLKTLNESLDLSRFGEIKGEQETIPYSDDEYGEEGWVHEGYWYTITYDGEEICSCYWSSQDGSYTRFSDFNLNALKEYIPEDYINKIENELNDIFDGAYITDFDQLINTVNNVVTKYVTKGSKLNEDNSDDGYVYVHTGLSDDKTEYILDSVIGQIADGIWEGSRGMDKIWQYMSVEKINGEVVMKVYTKYPSGFEGKTEDQIAKYVAQKIKQIAKINMDHQDVRSMDGSTAKWDRNETAVLRYFTRKDNEPVTVRDAYKVYDAILGRKQRIESKQLNEKPMYHSKFLTHLLNGVIKDIQDKFNITATAEFDTADTDNVIITLKGNTLNLIDATSYLSKIIRRDDVNFTFDDTINNNTVKCMVSPKNKIESKLQEDVDTEDLQFRYMLLDRLRNDCEYFLGYGNGYEPHLWAGNIEDQIAKMKKLYDSFTDEEKPEWITMDDINNYEKEMKELKTNKEKKTEDVPDLQTIQDIEEYINNIKDEHTKLILHHILEDEKSKENPSIGYLTMAIRKVLDIEQERNKEKKTESMSDDWYNTMYDKYVPNTGEADTVGGEILRTFSGISRMFYQNGDKIWRGNMRNNSYVLDPLADKLDDLLPQEGKDLMSKMANSTTDNAYEKRLNVLEDYVYNYLKDNDNLFGDDKIQSYFQKDIDDKEKKMEVTERDLSKDLFQDEANRRIYNRLINLDVYLEQLKIAIENNDTDSIIANKSKIKSNVAYLIPALNIKGDVKGLIDYLKTTDFDFENNFKETADLLKNINDKDKKIEDNEGSINNTSKDTYEDFLSLGLDFNDIWFSPYEWYKDSEKAKEYWYNIPYSHIIDYIDKEFNDFDYYRVKEACEESDVAKKRLQEVWKEYVERYVKDYNPTSEKIYQNYVNKVLDRDLYPTKTDDSDNIKYPEKMFLNFTEELKNKVGIDEAIDLLYNSYDYGRRIYCIDKQGYEYTYKIKDTEVKVRDNESIKKAESELRTAKSVLDKFLSPDTDKETKRYMFRNIQDLDNKIDYIKYFYKQLPEKPNWLSLEDIDNYREKGKNMLDSIHKKTESRPDKDRARAAAFAGSRRRLQLPANGLNEEAEIIEYLEKCKNQIDIMNVNDAIKNTELRNKLLTTGFDFAKGVNIVDDHIDEFKNTMIKATQDYFQTIKTESKDTYSPIAALPKQYKDNLNKILNEYFKDLDVSVRSYKYDNDYVVVIKTDDQIIYLNYRDNKVLASKFPGFKNFNTDSIDINNINQIIDQIFNITPIQFTESKEGYQDKCCMCGTLNLNGCYSVLNEKGNVSSVCVDCGKKYSLPEIKKKINSDVKSESKVNLKEDQYEAERRRGKPSIKKIAEDEYYDNQDWYIQHIKDYVDEGDFIKKEIAEIAQEYSLKEDSARNVCKEVYKLAKDNGLLK